MNKLLFSIIIKRANRKDRNTVLITIYCGFIQYITTYFTISKFKCLVFNLKQNKLAINRRKYKGMKTQLGKVKVKGKHKHSRYSKSKGKIQTQQV